MKRILVFILLVSCNLVFSQEKEFRLGFLLGGNKMLWGMPLERTKIGYSYALEASFKYRKKNNGISFEPMLLLGSNSFYSKTTEYVKVKVTQAGLSLLPVAGLRLNRTLTFKTGLSLQMVSESAIRVTLTGNSAYYSYGNQYLDQGFNQAYFNAGIVAGLSASLGEKKRCNFNILFQQFMNPFLNTDYVLTSFPVPGQNTTIFSKAARASVLMMGFNFKISKKREAVNED